MKIVIFILSLFVVFYIPVQYHKYSNNIVSFTYLLISCWSVFAIFIKRNISFSLYKTFYTFSLLFFGIAPFIQYSDGIVFWSSTQFLTEQDYIVTNIIILFIFVVIEIVYMFVYKDGRVNRGGSNIYLKREFNLKTKSIFILLAFLSFFFTLKSKDFNIIGLFFRGSDFLSENKDVTPLDQIVNNFVRPMSLFAFMVYYNYSRKFGLFGFFIFIIGIICNFPTGLARYNVAALYIPLFLIIFPALRAKYYFNMILVGGFLIVFPFLNNFRNFSEDSKINIGFDFEMFREAHFDSYSSLLRVIKYELVTYGNQLAAVIFFWVPRSLWDSKPKSSGIYLAENLDFYFSNVSVNFFAEGYLNFGMFGIFIFAVGLAIIIAKLDKKFLEFNYSMTSHNEFTLYYYLLIGFFIFILRGDLLSSFAYLIGFLLNLNFLQRTVKLLNN